MRWILKLFDKIYKNLYSFFATIFFCIIFIIFVSLSAQYLGDTIGRKILNSRSIHISVIDSNNDVQIKKIIHSIEKNYNLKNSKILVKKIKEDDKKINAGKFEILITQNKELMEKLSIGGKLVVLDRNIFPPHNLPLVDFSKFDEYAEVRIASEDIKFYIAISNNLSNLEKTKAIKAISNISSTILAKTPYEIE